MTALSWHSPKTTHTALDAMVGQQLLELLTGILAALVAVMQQLGDRAGVARWP